MLALLEILVGWHHFYLGRSVSWWEAKNGFKKSILLKKIWKERFATSPTPTSSPNISCGPKSVKFRRKKGSKKRFGSEGCPGWHLETSGVAKHDSGAKIGSVFDHTEKLPNLTPDIQIFEDKSLKFPLFSLLWPSSQFRRFGGCHKCHRCHKCHSSIKLGLFCLQFYLGLSEGTTGRCSHKFQLKRSSSEGDIEGSNWQFWPFSENP